MGGFSTPRLIYELSSGDMRCRGYQSGSNVGEARGGFTVQQGGAANVQIYLTGVAAREAPQEQPMAPTNAYVLGSVSNLGNIDSPTGFVTEPVTSPFSLTSVDPPGVVDTPTLIADNEGAWNYYSWLLESR